MKYGESERDAELDMIEWGKAAREDDIKIGYKPTFLASARGSTVKSASIDPEVFWIIETAVSELKITDPQVHEVIRRIFVDNESYRSAGRQMGLNHNIIQELKSNGVAFVCATLHFSQKFRKKHLMS